MNLKYSLSRDDSLTGILFLISQAPVTRKRKYIEQYIFPVVYTVMGVILFHINNSGIGIITVILSGIFWIVLYPYISKYSIKRKYIKSTGAPKNNKSEVVLTVNPKNLIVNDETGEAKFSIADITRIVELNNCFLIGINYDRHLTVPKNSIETETLNQFIIKISTASQIKVSDMQNWKWK